ncbi:MAG: hypothetical protein KAR39_13120 [Thermoplasmata archaeon]|nr:hypothetical protein [Thermoplasmata archaeon]
MGTYYWIEKYDNGDIRLKLMSHKECEEEVNERARIKKIPVYITHGLPKYLNEMKEGRVIIISGDSIHPVPIQEVMSYAVPLAS